MNTMPGNKYKLEDLIDIEHFQDLQDKLNEIYSFPSSIIDNDGNILTATAWQDICLKFHRKNKECEKACIQSDKYITEHLDEANPAVTYQCPHGLVDNATPIIIDGVHYGNFFTGQFFLEEPDIEFFRKQAKMYGFPEESYLEAVKKVPVWTKEQLNNYLFFIKGLIAIISESGLKNLKGAEARKQIREREELLNKSQEMASIGSFVWDMVANKITWSHNLYEIYGYDEETFEDDIFEVSNRLIHPDDAEHAYSEIEEMIEKTSSWDAEFRIIKPDGNERVIRSKGEVDRDADGNQIKCYGINQDVTERKRAEELLINSEKKHRTILQTAIDGFMLIDRQGNIREVNDSYCKMSGYTRIELLKMNAGVLEAPEPSVELKEKIDEIIDRKTLRFIRRHKRKDGTLFDVEISSQYQPEEEVFVCFIRDITERKEMESQLEQAKKMESIGTLAGGIAHDFNNILSPIMMHAELAMEDLPADDPLQHCMKEIFNSGERARDLVKQILTFARKRSEKRIPLKSSLIINEAVGFLRSTIPSSINIQYNVRSKKDMILADPTQLNQIIMNLCTNAAHAMREKGGLLEIILDSKHISPRDAKRFFNLKSGNYVKLTIRDDGTGISPDILSRIFEPYYTTKKVGEGTGLGLATVHGIVQNYGGDITVESTVGKGTAFHVYLPSAGVEISDDTENKIEIQKGTESILLVDDEKAAVDITKKMLEKFGYRVTSTTSSTEALEIFLNNSKAFDLVITDMTMPEMTGDVLSKEIISLNPEVPVILCTGFSDNINEEKAKEIGIRRFILKPIVMSELAKRIREVLDKTQ